jgi:hypothetical protein
MLFLIIKGRAMFDQNGEFLPHVRLAKDLVEKYDNRVRPVLQHSKPTQVLEIGLYCVEGNQ